jgi:hypothetical protein
VIVITERIVTLCGDSKAAGAWALTDGFAFVSHAGAVLSGRHPLGVGSRKSPHEKETFPARQRIILAESGNFIGRKSYPVRGTLGSGENEVAANIAKLPGLLRPRSDASSRGFNKDNVVE